MLPTGEQPGKGELGDGATLGLRKGGELVNGFDVLFEVAGLPAGVGATEVGLVVLVRRLCSAGEEAASERPGADETEPSARTLVQAALACLDVALSEWTLRGGATPLDGLLDKAFATIFES